VRNTAFDHYADPVQPHPHVKITKCRCQYVTDFMKPEVATGPRPELFPVNSALDIHISCVRLVYRSLGI